MTNVSSALGILGGWIHSTHYTVFLTTVYNQAGQGTNSGANGAECSTDGPQFQQKLLKNSFDWNIRYHHHQSSPVFSKTVNTIQYSSIPALPEDCFCAVKANTNYNNVRGTNLYITTMGLIICSHNRFIM